MTDKNTITKDEIQAFVDNELTCIRRAEIEELILNDDELRKEINDYKKLNTDLQSLFKPVLDEPIPEKLLSINNKEKKPITLSLSYAASILLTISIGLVIGWVSRGELEHSRIETTQSTQVLVDDAFSYHAVYTPEIKHPVEVASNQEKHLVKWLSKRLSTKINPPVLTTVGYSLLGGRLLTTNNEPAAQFMYEDNMGQRLTLFARKRMDNELETAFRYASKNGTNGFYWADQTLSFVLLSNISKTEINAIAHTVYEDLNK